MSEMPGPGNAGPQPGELGGDGAEHFRRRAVDAAGAESGADATGVEADNRRLAEQLRLLEHNPAAREVLDAFRKRIEAADAQLAESHHRIVELERTIEVMSYDPTTHAYNREGWNGYLQSRYGISHSNPEHVEPHREGQEPVHVVVGVMDVCDLKIVNDKFGHDKGDEMLRRAVEIMREQLREGDPVVRFGGDEFAFVLEVTPGLSEHEIVAMKQGIQQRFNAALAAARPKSLFDMDPSEQPEPIVALGMADGLMVDFDTFTTMKQNNADAHVTTYHLLLHDADAAMYEEKDRLKKEGISLPRGAMAPVEMAPLTAEEAEETLAPVILLRKIADTFDTPLTELQQAAATEAYEALRRTLAARFADKPRASLPYARRAYGENA